MGKGTGLARGDTKRVVNLPWKILGTFLKNNWPRGFLMTSYFR